MGLDLSKGGVGRDGRLNFNRVGVGESVISAPGISAATLAHDAAYYARTLTGSGITHLGTWRATAHLATWVRAAHVVRAEAEYTPGSHLLAGRQPSRTRTW